MKNCYRHLKNYYVLVFLALQLLTSCNAASKDKTLSTVGTDTSGYQLMWSDEFNGSNVDTGNWNFEIGGHGWGNHEQEYYQAVNATVSNGNLIIMGKKEDVQSNH